MREIVRVVAGRFVGMVVIVLVVLVAVGAATVLSPKWYRSEVRMLARPSGAGNPLSNQSTVRDELSLFVTTQREIILSDWVLATALMRLDGQPTPTIESGNELSPQDRDRRMEQLQSQFGNWQAKVDKYIAEHMEQMRDIRKRVDVVTPGGADASFTQTFTIRVDWPEERDLAAKQSKNPLEQAAQRTHGLAKCIKEAYLTRFSQLERERMVAAARFITQESLVSARKNLDDATAALNVFTEKEGTSLETLASMMGKGGAGGETGFAGRATASEAEVTRLESENARLKKLREVVASRLGEARQEWKKDKLDDVPGLEEQLADPANANNPQKLAKLTKDLGKTLKPIDDFTMPLAVDLKDNASLKAILDAIDKKRSMVKSLAPQFQDDYQQIVVSRSEMVGLWRTLFRMLDDQVKELDDRVAVNEAPKVYREKDAASLNERKKTLAAKVASYERLLKDQEAAQKLYDDQKKSVIEAATAKELAANPILVSDLGGPSMPHPDDPRRPVPWLNMLIAAVSGLILALVYAFVADHYDHTIKSIDDAERYLGVPVLGSVPKLGRHIIRTG
jgi:capsular polysaccharide biosynthesis protein